MHTAKSVVGLVALFTLVGAYLSPDHLLVLAAGAELALAVWFLWPATDAPILLLPFGVQWLSVAMKPIETALTGQPLGDFGEYGHTLTDGAWFGLAGLGALGFGMWLASRRRQIDWAETLARDASHWSAALVVQMSLAFIVAGTTLQLVAPHMGPAYQILLAFAGVKIIGLFVLAYWCLKTGRALWILATVTAIEVVIGLTGFFADFRMTFLVLLAAAAAALPRLGVRGIMAMFAIFAAMLVVTVFWTSIKTDYRGFLDQDSHQQVVDRSLSERLSYVGQAADRFDENQFQTGLRALADRISYIDFLDATLKFVPEEKPHENGRLLKGALINIFEPRIFFPDKPPTPDDSMVTARYTGIQLKQTGYTSISIGYLGELYIDFGYVGGIVGSFLIGAFAGFAYRLIRDFRGLPMFFSYGAAVMVLVDFTAFETDLVRFLGSAITLFLAALVIQRFVAPQALLALARREARQKSHESAASGALAPFL